MSNDPLDPRVLQYVEAEGGPPLSLGQATTIAGRAAWTDGALSIFDQVIPPGLIVAPHVHEKESQASFVISGRLGFWVGGEEVEVGAGGYVHRPVGVPHSLWNKGLEPARMLEITTPGGSFEIYMTAMSDLLDSGEATPETAAALAAEYGVHFVPEPFADLCERHGVSPEGGFWK